mgnify:CR=1 FL=1
MRNYVFEFEQQVAMRLGLNLKELLFLDYILQFVNSGNMRSKRVCGKYYFRLTYKKIMEDLPILKVKERQIRNMITKLENMHLVERLSELKNEMHLNVDFDALFGNKLPDGFDLSAIGFHDEGNGVLTIDYYDIKKIKIITEYARVRDVDKDLLTNLFYENVSNIVSQTIFQGFIKDKVFVEEIKDGYVLLSVTNVKYVGKEYGEKVKFALEKSLKSLIEES